MMVTNQMKYHPIGIRSSLSNWLFKIVTFIEMILLRDHRQIAFATLNRFSLLSNPSPLTYFSSQTISIWMEYQPKLNEKYTSFLNYISSFEGIVKQSNYGTKMRNFLLFPYPPEMLLKFLCDCTQWLLLKSTIKYF